MVTLEKFSCVLVELTSQTRNLDDNGVHANNSVGEVGGWHRIPGEKKTFLELFWRIEH